MSAFNNTYMHLERKERFDRPGARKGKDGASSTYSSISNNCSTTLSCKVNYETQLHTVMYSASKRRHNNRERIRKRKDFVGQYSRGIHRQINDKQFKKEMFIYANKTNK